MKSFLKNFVKKTLFNAKLYRINALLNRCYILIYHMISDTPTGFYPEVATTDFEKHIAHLSKNYKIISLDELVWRFKKKESLRSCVVITFDDGFKDNYENAYPILKKYNAPATIFLTTGRIEDGNPPWFIKMRYIFMKTQKTHLKFKFDNRAVSLSMTTKHERLAASTRVMSHLHSCSDEMRLDLLSKLNEELNETDFQEIDDLMLNWDQIREMSENDISIGAHTINHPVLSRLSSVNIEEEILKSKILIEQKINQPVTSFSYPFGKKEHYNNDCIKILKKLSMDCAVTTELGPNSHTTDLFELKRYIQGRVKPYDFFWNPYSL